MPKVEKIPHPRSRKAEQLLKKNTQKLRKIENKNLREKKLSVLHKHCLWYHDYVKRIEEEEKRKNPQDKNKNQAKKRFNESEMHAMIESFIKHREEKWREKMEKKRGKLGTSLQLAAMEREEYEKGAGLKAPDLLNKENYTKFLQWDRESKTLVAIKIKCFKSQATLASIWKSVEENEKSNNIINEK